MIIAAEPAPARPQRRLLPVSLPLGLPVALLAAVLLLGTSAPAAAAHPRAEFPAQSLGNSGLDVTAVQHLLRASGQAIHVSGTFNRATQAAVAAFQRSADLRVNGVADVATWQALVTPLEPGTSGEAVLAAQQLLIGKLGAELSLSGVYDDEMRAEVSAFQRRMGLGRSGALDLQTWRNLAWHYAYPDFRNTNLCDYHSGNGRASNWATAAAIGQLEAAAALFHKRTGLNVSVGELSWRHGGRLPGHATHQLGLDVDLGLIRRDGRHCRRLGLDYRQAQYDRDATRELIKAIHETAPGMVKVIYFNDPVLIREGLVTRYPNHHHHLHVRYCEVGHAQRAYRCEAPALPDATVLEAALAADLDDAQLPLRYVPLHRHVLRF